MGKKKLVGCFNGNFLILLHASARVEVEHFEIQMGPTCLATWLDTKYAPLQKKPSDVAGIY